MVPPRSAARNGGRWRDRRGIELALYFYGPLLVRHLADDLRTFYHEAIASQPGPGAPNHDALTDWIFRGTALGDTLLAIAEHLTDDDRPLALLVCGWMIPEGHFRGGCAFPTPEQITRGGFSQAALSFDIRPAEEG